MSDTQPEPTPDQPAAPAAVPPTVPPSTEIPMRFRLVVLGLLTVTLVVHIFVDAYLDEYDGKGTSWLLGAIVGSAFGFNTLLAELFKGRGAP